MFPFFFCAPPNRDIGRQMLSAHRLQHECKLIWIDVIPGEINAFFNSCNYSPQCQFIKRFAWSNCWHRGYWRIFITFQLGIESTQGSHSNQPTGVSPKSKVYSMETLLSSRTDAEPEIDLTFNPWLFHCTQILLFLIWLFFFSETVQITN